MGEVGRIAMVESAVKRVAKESGETLVHVVVVNGEVKGIFSVLQDAVKLQKFVLRTQLKTEVGA